MEAGGRSRWARARVASCSECLIRLEAEMTGEHEEESEAAVPAVLLPPLYRNTIYIQEGNTLQSSTLGHSCPPSQATATSLRKLQASESWVYYTLSETHKKCNLTDYHHKSVQKIKTHA